MLKQDDDLIYQVIKSLVEQLLDSMFEIYNTDGVILALNKLLSGLKDINILDLIVQAFAYCDIENDKFRGSTWNDQQFGQSFQQL